MGRYGIIKVGDYYSANVGAGAYLIRVLELDYLNMETEIVWVLRASERRMFRTWRVGHHVWFHAADLSALRVL